jgi:hypothetical protein
MDESVFKTSPATNDRKLKDKIEEEESLRSKAR